MSEPICVECQKPIEGEKPAIAPDGPMHPKCAKRATAHGRQVDISNGALFLAILELQREVAGLKMELRDVKRGLTQLDVSVHGRSIDFRSGGQP